MGTTADKLQYLIDAKNSISAAIELKGGTVPHELSGYGPAIAALDGLTNYTRVKYANTAPLNGLSAIYQINGALNASNFSVPLSAVEVFCNDTVTEIPDTFFVSNRNLTHFESSGLTTLGTGSFGSCSNLSAVVLPNTLTSVGTGCFGNCTGLKSINIPNSLTAISDYMLNSCSGLTSITIPEGVKSIGTGSFYSCTGLGSIVFPNTLSVIRQQAFQGCSGLSATLVIPDSVKTIEASAFRYCTHLTDVVVGNGVTNIYGYAFSDSTKLSSITFGNSLSSFSAGIFSNCTGLSSIAFPDSLTVFGGSSGGIFKYCSNLTMIDFGYTRTTVPTMAATTNFANIPANYKIYVPSALLNDWKAAANWSDVASHIYAHP